MSLSFLKSIHSRLVEQQVEDKLVLVPLSADMANMTQMFELNKTAAWIWHHLVEVESIQELAQEMVQKFEVDSQTALHDIDAFINQASAFFASIQME